MPQETNAPEEPRVPSLPNLGQTLGSYRLVKLLGVGGMGRVYVAEHVKLGRKVALKLLLPEFAAHPEVVQRFFNEARAVNQISHPNIVEIFDFVEDPDGFNYFIMELLDGRDLRKVREQDGPFLLGRAVAVAKQVASALASAHGQEIVHRDIKPDNVVLLPREGNPNFVKLLDFGIAKLSSGIYHEQKTRIGMVLGTPGYMSPEQAFDRPIDGRSDVYSLGVLLHWMLVDTLPEAGNLPMKSAQAQPGRDPLTQTKRGQPIPEPIAQLVQKCLQFDPDDRVQSMERIVQELKPYLPTSVEPGPDELSAPAPTQRWGEEPKAPPRATERADAIDPDGATRLAAPQEGATRLKVAGDSLPDEVPPPRSGKLWLIAAAVAVVVAAGGWFILQPGGRPPPSPAPVVNPEPVAAKPAPAPVFVAPPSAAPPANPVPAVAPHAPVTTVAAPAAEREARPAAPAPKTRHHASRKSAKVEKQGGDDTEILDPLAE